MRVGWRIRFTAQVPETNKEFLFIDESGDPGPAGNPIYILVGMHLDAGAVDELRRHLTAFRYHHDVVREFKAQRWADKFSSAARHLLEPLAYLTKEGRIVATANWLHKERFRAAGGPYLAAPGDSAKFRNFQVRLLLERHRKRKAWGENLDVVLDRWRMDAAQRRNLEDYLRGNYKLRPMVTVTTVDSLYVDAIHVVDIYTRVIRRVLEGTASSDEQDLCLRLVDLEEAQPLHRGS